MKRLFACLFVALRLAAQQDMGLVTGVVTDASAAAIAGAKVTLRDKSTNETRSVETNETGTYTVGPVRIGSYELSIEKPGFRRAHWQEIVIHSQDRVRADVQLEIGQTTEAISVTAEVPVLQAESSSLAHVVEEREIRGLPLNGRNFQQLAWLTAGVMPSTRGRDRESGFNSHGQPVTQNNFIIDGIDNNNNVMGMQDRKAQVIVPSLDAVAEFKVQTSNYSAEFGRNSGAVMLVNIKSGSNEFHGTAFEYLRNNYFDARDMFSYNDRNRDGRADPEILKQNQFGFTFGGPVLRNRTFFFGSWEGRRERRSQNDLSIVPSADERNGVFTGPVIRDPSTGQPFPGNRIPRERFDSVSARMLELWPMPNFGGSGTRQNFVSGPPWTTDRDQTDIRIDHNVTVSDKIFGRFSKSRFDNLRAGPFPQPARGDQGNDRALDDNDAHSAVFSYTKILTPTLLNEFRYGFVRQKVDKREMTDQLLSELTAKYGISGIPGNDRLFGLPRIALTGNFGYTGLGEPGSMPNFKIHQVHQYLNNLSWNRGTHGLKFGGDIRWNRSDIFGGASSHGNFMFDGQFTGVSFADFLLGLPSSVNLTSQLNGQMRFQNYMFYAQDDWKLTPRLTLNLGIRYELTSPWYDKHDNMNRLVISGPDVNQIVKAGYCGDSWRCRGLVNPDKNNWAPRLGFAWQVADRTVIRAGAGVFYGGQGSLGADSRQINNWPFNRSATVQSTPARPALKFSDGLPANFLGVPTAPPANSNWIVWSEDFPAPTIYQWNLAVQRELGGSFSLTTAYVGSSSNYLMDNYNWNGSAPGPLATEVQRRNLPQWNNINYYSPRGHANYHGLDVQLDKRYSKGLSLSAAYTWSHSIDDLPEQFGSPGGGHQDFRDFRQSRGSSNFDVRHRAVGSVVYEVPSIASSRLLNAVAGGWQLSNILSMQSGHPFTVTLSNPRPQLGATGVGGWRPDRIGDGKLENPTADRWIDSSAFILPRDANGAFRFGNAGRSILTSDGMFNLDTGVMKYFSLTERVRLQVRAEAFNLTNTPTLDDPNSVFDAADFGKVRTTVSTPRQFQFALRISF